MLISKGDLKNSTLPVNEILLPTPIHYGWIVFHLPVFIEILVLISLIYIFRKKLWKEEIWVFLILFTALSFIMITKIFPWDYAPSILQTLQFPWRLALYVMFGGILLSGVAINYFKEKKYFNIMFYVILVFALFSLYYYMPNPDAKIMTSDTIDYVRGMGNEKEYLPVKTDELIDDFIIHSGEGNFNIILDDVPKLVFNATVFEKCKVELPRIYYPGYRLECNGKEVELEEGENGYLQAVLNSSGVYTLTYEKSFIMKFSWILTLTTFIVLIIIIVRTKE